MPAAAERERFERLMLPHLDAAYALARWLLRDEEQAREAVQEAYLRALRYFGSFRGEQGRPWLLGVVRNVCQAMLQRERQEANSIASLDEETLGECGAAPGALRVLPVNPEVSAIERSRRDALERCLRQLPFAYREVLVLRELHGCSYREIAAIAAVPMGTVMSRLARARRLLFAKLAASEALRETGT